MYSASPWQLFNKRLLPDTCTPSAPIGPTISVWGCPVAEDNLLGDVHQRLYVEDNDRTFKILLSMYNQIL